MISLPSLPKHSSKLFIYFGIALATAIALVLLLRPTPVKVEVGRVEQGKLQVTVNVEGMTRVRDRYILAAEVTGHLDRITLDECDVVEARDIVARIDPLPHTTAALAQARSRIAAAQANQRQVEARVAQTQAAFAQTQRDRQRAQYSAETGVISRQAREQAELNERTKIAEHNAALQAAQAARIASTHVRAHVSATPSLLKKYFADEQSAHFMVHLY
ncbi:RND family efflux transporter MFP subunit [Gloeocapsa sp. PCC 7428]|uniref:RND family efflux transporter MFP subunit n=1 Tax=Gloeocapsa sp. PCC 7428 TaxID=1173026 RepID=UPI0002A5DF85|nr:RND family efflux transporter MFP subunit [Gloeocapsa sp. PCC 7428]AFZ32407.1 RND family efflux transporter MFP subunit [Gloeocapsa sp. PCC 7428]